jgi:prepilin-type N-terminal cleavage/methylation domain-containing protein
MKIKAKCNGLSRNQRIYTGGIRLNNTKGFSYIEVLMALAVLSILLIPLFPAMTQAGQNAAAARDGYTAHLRAQEIMLIVKDAVSDGEDPQPLVAAYAKNNGELFQYGYWVSQGLSYRSPGSPPIQVSLQSPGDMILVTALVWDNEGRLAGRATGGVNIWGK